MAVALAKSCSKATVIATDVSESALALAKRNAGSHNVLSQVEFRRADSLSALARGELVDLILSNPPYISTGEIDSLQPEVRNYDPRLALDGGTDGLHFYRILAAEGQSRLRCGGRLLAEFGDGQEQAIKDLFTKSEWQSVEIANDLTDRPRIVIASARH